jgi:hypothetical protein
VNIVPFWTENQIKYWSDKMTDKIYMRQYLKRNELKYYVLDWQYTRPESNLGNYEETEITEDLILNMIEINPDNLEILGYFHTEKQLNEHIQSLIDDCELIRKDINTIEWQGPDFYVKWGLDEFTICNALEALDTEYDLSLENGNWMSWLTGWNLGILDDTKTIKDCLMDLYGCEIDTSCEQAIEEHILSYFKESQLNKEDKTIISDDINNIDLTFNEVKKIMGEADAVGRIDPGYLP